MDDAQAERVIDDCLREDFADAQAWTAAARNYQQWVANRDRIK